MMEYYSVIKRIKILIHATTWVNFENVTLNKKPDRKGHTVNDYFYIEAQE
jgi:hypothetical protein